MWSSTIQITSGRAKVFYVTIWYKNALKGKHIMHVLVVKNLPQNRLHKKDLSDTRLSRQ